MMLMGGGFKGGQVIADWPGLRQAQLYEDRDRIMRGVYPDLVGLNPSAGFT